MYDTICNLKLYLKNMLFNKYGILRSKCGKVGTQNITTFLRFRANTKYKAVVIDDVKCV